MRFRVVCSAMVMCSALSGAAFAQSPRSDDHGSDDPVVGSEHQALRSQQARGGHDVLLRRTRRCSSFTAPHILRKRASTCRSTACR